LAADSLDEQPTAIEKPTASDATVITQPRGSPTPEEKSRDRKAPFIIFSIHPIHWVLPVWVGHSASTHPPRLACVVKRKPKSRSAAATQFPE
jgi:hypothetical protein